MAPLAYIAALDAFLKFENPACPLARRGSLPKLIDALNQILSLFGDMDDSVVKKNDAFFRLHVDLVAQLFYLKYAETKGEIDASHVLVVEPPFSSSKKHVALMKKKLAEINALLSKGKGLVGIPDLDESCAELEEFLKGFLEQPPEEANKSPKKLVVVPAAASRPDNESSDDEEDDPDKLSLDPDRITTKAQRFNKSPHKKQQPSQELKSKQKQLSASSTSTSSATLAAAPTTPRSLPPISPAKGKASAVSSSQGLIPNPPPSEDASSPTLEAKKKSTATAPSAATFKDNRKQSQRRSRSRSRSQSRTRNTEGQTNDFEPDRFPEDEEELLFSSDDDQQQKKSTAAGVDKKDKKRGLTPPPPRRIEEEEDRNSVAKAGRIAGLSINEVQRSIVRLTRDFKGSRGQSPLKNPYQRYRASDNGDDEEEVSVDIAASQRAVQRNLQRTPPPRPVPTREEREEMDRLRQEELNRRQLQIQENAAVIQAAYAAERNVGYGARGRKRWTDDELAALMDGMYEHGTKWNLISRDHDQFHTGRLKDRTQVDLKDKARNEYRRRLQGGIPLECFKFVHTERAQAAVGRLLGLEL
ncbi:UNVERIFIED_CONTAM: hypothetical protein HDU68_010525 [Siphonaria sp. JEL0065]|nr:hypothetical protein HDU68_010525 [Siphonaria sp. JEL0065]